MSGALGKRGLRHGDPHPSHPWAGHERTLTVLAAEMSGDGRHPREPEECRGLLGGS